MFDLPTDEERDLIWPIHLTNYGLDLKSKRPEDEGWTGAEIRNCCRAAKKMKVSLVKAAEYISPVAVTMADEIDAMRRQASGHFKSAATPGVYNFTRAAQSAPTPGKSKRSIRLD